MKNKFFKLNSAENRERMRLIPRLPDAPRPRGTEERRRTIHRSIACLGIRPVGEGAGRNTRLRRRSSVGTAKARGRVGSLNTARGRILDVPPRSWRSFSLSSAKWGRGPGRGGARQTRSASGCRRTSSPQPSPPSDGGDLLHRMEEREFAWPVSVVLSRCPPRVRWPLASWRCS
jgi:hypothetical protein